MLTAVPALAVRARSARYHALGAPPLVMNGCSDVMVLAFGERGRHARTAVGVQSLPRGVAVEVAPARPRSLAPPRSALPGERKAFSAGRQVIHRPILAAHPCAPPINHPAPLPSRAG